MQRIWRRFVNSLKRSSCRSDVLRFSGKTMREMNDYNRRLIEEFRANGGKVSGQFEHTPNRRQVKPGPSGSRSRWEVLKRVWRLGMEHPPLRASVTHRRACPKWR